MWDFYTESLAQRGHHIRRRDKCGGVDALAFYSSARPYHRYTNQILRHAHTFVNQSVIAEIIAMIGEIDDERILTKAAAFEKGKQPAQLIVDQAKHAQIIRARPPPQQIVARIGIFFEAAQPAPFVTFLLQNFRSNAASRNRFRRQETEVRLRNLIGIVRLRKTDP